MSQQPLGPTSAAPSPWPPRQPSAGRSASQLPAIIAIVIALVAVAVAIAAWFKPTPKAEVPAAKTYTEQETADAKKAVCDAYGTAYHALEINKRKSIVNQADSFAVIVNTRLTVHVVADFLLNALDNNAATQPSLSARIRDLASSYQEIVLQQISDADQSQLDASYQRADAMQSAVAQDCR